MECNRDTEMQIILRERERASERASERMELAEN